VDVTYVVKFDGGRVGRHEGVAPMLLDVPTDADGNPDLARLESLMVAHLKRARLLASRGIEVDVSAVGTGGGGTIYAGARRVGQFKMERKGQI
jgi:hypothetical protein